MVEHGKRRWLQIHLSTALVLMFAAGGLMWLNSTVRISTEPFIDYDASNGRDTFTWGGTSNFASSQPSTLDSNPLISTTQFNYLERNGWPYAFSEMCMRLPMPKSLNLFDSFTSDSPPIIVTRSFRSTDLVWNILIGLALLAALAVICEFLIPRKNAGREASPPGPI